MSIIADLIHAGVAADLVGRVAAEIETARAEGVLIGRAEGDPQATARRERDAARKRDVRRQSADLSADNPQNVRRQSAECPQTPPVSARSSLGRLSKNLPSETTSPLPLEGAGKQKSKRGARLDPAFEPDAESISIGIELGFDRPAITGAFLDEFRDYWTALPGSRALKLDWQKTFRNRLRQRPPRTATATGPPVRENALIKAGRELMEEAIARENRNSPDIVGSDDDYPEIKSPGASNIARRFARDERDREGRGGGGFGA